jgi:ATP-dependent DNA helicase RecQ
MSIALSRVSHIFLVERKINDRQVVDDVVKEIKNESCLCYCLTPKCCRKMKDLFLRHNIKVDCYYSDQEIEEKEMVLDQFKHGTLQVLCATKALGRGVHIEKCPIRFVVHTTMPVSLAGMFSN